MGIASRIAAATEKLSGNYPTGGIQYNLGKLEDAAESVGGGIGEPMLAKFAATKPIVNTTTQLDELQIEDVTFGGHQVFDADGYNSFVAAGLTVQAYGGAAASLSATLESGAAVLTIYQDDRREYTSKIEPVDVSLTTQIVDNPYDDGLGVLISFVMPDIDLENDQVFCVWAYDPNAA
jgi:hypothetical protein